MAGIEIDAEMFMLVGDLGQCALDKRRCGAKLIQGLQRALGDELQFVYCAKRSFLSERSRQNYGNLSVPSATPKTIIITFCRAANEVVHSVLVKYVIFEKFRSDPEKYRC